MDNTTITKAEELFCELYANGDAPFGGNAARCYEEAFNYTGGMSRGKALKLLACEHIRQKLEELEKLTYEEAKYMKKFLTRNLVSIVDECTNKSAVNKNGREVSPAALRSVAVSAAKSLMELYPVKEAQKISLEGDGDGTITFNVVMPEATKTIKEAGSGDE